MLDLDSPDRWVEDLERYTGRMGRVNLSSSGRGADLGPEIAARREERRLEAQVDD